MVVFPHFRGWCFHQHLGYLQVGLFIVSKFFSFQFFSLQVCDLFMLFELIFTIFGKCSKWASFIHIAYLWWQPLFFIRYSLPLKHVRLAWNMPLILVVSLCVMASTYGHIFCFWFSFCSSHKNNLSFEMWKVRCATKLTNNFKVYTSGCGLCKIS